jgi:hypothetical protein
MQLGRGDRDLPPAGDPRPRGRAPRLREPADNVAFTRLLTAGPWRFDAGEIVALTRAAGWDRRPVFDSATEINLDQAVTVLNRSAESTAARDEILGHSQRLGSCRAVSE